MTTIIGIAGSLREKSFNRALLRAAESRVPDGTTLESVSFGDFPVYDGDLEAEGMPQAVQDVKARIAGADGLLIATPEYNNSVPGPLKNAIDWLSRPPKDQARVFAQLPVAVIGATPGRGGTRFAQTALLPVFRTLGMRPWYDKVLYVAGAGSVFDADLELTDATVDKLLRELLAGFADYCRQASPRRRA